MRLNRKIILSLLGTFLTIYAYAGINDSFSATIGETELIFKITGENEVQIGDGMNSAVSSHALDSLIIPSIVKKDDISYRVTRIGHKAFSGCTWLKKESNQ